MTAIVKVTLCDSVPHEDVGFGMLDNCRQKGVALDKVRAFLPLLSHGTTPISPTDNKLFDPVQESRRDGRVEAHAPYLWQLARQLPL